MYITIDTERMAICHKAEDYEVAAGLAHIELSHTSVHIMPGDYPAAFNGMTDLELKLLYRNATGNEFEGYSHPHLIAAVCQVTKALPHTDAVPAEVAQQCRKINISDRSPYRYVKGSYTPARLQDIFQPLPLQASAARVAAIPPAGPVPAAAHATPAVKPISAPRAGGVREVVWGEADRRWEAAGKPRNLSVVLALRKDLMNVLETEFGVKRTSSSTSLGEWQKARLNS